MGRPSGKKAYLVWMVVALENDDTAQVVSLLIHSLERIYITYVY